MRWSEQIKDCLAILFLLAIARWISRSFFDSLKPLPLVFVGLVIIILAIGPYLPDSEPSSVVTAPIPGSVDQVYETTPVLGPVVDPRDEFIQLAEALDTVEELLRSYGDCVEKTATTCLEAFRKIHKEQQDQLRQYTDFKRQHSEQLGLIVNVLDGHRTDITEASRAAARNDVSLCNIIGQYRQGIEDNQNSALKHLISVNEIVKGQETAMASTRELVVERTDFFQAKINGHEKMVEENKKLMKDHGALINSVVSDHVQLIAEYQLALDGILLMNTANHIFSLIQEPLGWETLGAINEGFDESNPMAEHKGPWSDAEPGSMVDNIRKLSRTFRGPSTQTAQAKPVLTDQILRTIRDTVQSAVDEQHTEDLKQLRKAQEDIDKLRAELQPIQELRELDRRSERLDMREKQQKEILKQQDEILKRQAKILAIFHKDPQRINTDPEFRAEVDEYHRIMEEYGQAAADTTD